MEIKMSEERQVKHVCEECGSNNFLCKHSHDADDDGKTEWYLDEVVCTECDHSQSALPDVRVDTSILDFVCPFCTTSGKELPEIVIIIDGYIQE